MRKNAARALDAPYLLRYNRKRGASAATGGPAPIKEGHPPMFFNTGSIGIMRSSLEGLSLQQQVILHNLANVDTPRFNASSVTFEDTLKGINGRYDLKAHVVTDESTSMRGDLNNVDADTESLKLYQNYVQQVYLYQKISGQFTNLRYVLNQGPK